jgi:hypothetical protein
VLRGTVRKVEAYAMRPYVRTTDRVLSSRRAAMIQAALSRSRKAVATADGQSDYFAAEPHYLSLVNRIVAALSAAGGFVLVTGDPPASPYRLSQALRKATWSHLAVVDIACPADSISEELSRASSVVAPPPPSGGATKGLEPPQSTRPLFVFADADKLSDRQIRGIFEAIEHGSQKGAAALLLARSGFAGRLEGGPLQFLKERLVARFEFQEVGQDVGVEFLRHQLAARQARSDSMRLPTAVLRGLAASGVLLIGGIGVFLFLHYRDLAGDPPARSDAGIVSSHETGAPRQTPSETPAVGSSSITRDKSPTVVATSPEPLTKGTPPRDGPAPTDTRATLPAAAPDPSDFGQRPETMLPAVSPAPKAQQPAPKAASNGTSAPQAPSGANQQPLPTEVATLVTRGDGFLSAGDITSARLFYERAADAGVASAALRLGATFDPDFLSRVGIQGIPGDAAQAASWYRRARDLGERAATDRLKDLDQQRAGEPTPPPLVH